MESATSEIILQTNQSKSAEINNTPTLVSVEDTIEYISSEFKNRQDLDPPKIESFIKDHVRVVRVGNVDVTIIDQEHSEYKGELDPVLNAFIKSERTKTVVVEYFLPELQQNAAKMGDTGIKHIEKSAAEGGRGKMFMHIANEAKEVGKTVSTVDIANKAEYEAYWGAIRCGILPIVASSLISMDIGDRMASALALYIVSFGADIYMEGEGMGIYNINKISELENLYVSMEDARRVFAAKALNQMAVDYNNEYPKNSDDDRSQIVVVYPKAHAMRIENYMTNQSLFTKSMKTIKNLGYRILPRLDYSYRTYSWKDTFAKALNKPELASWQLTTSKNVKILS